MLTHQKSAKPKVKKQVVQQKEMKHYTSNESLNKILNETVMVIGKLLVVKEKFLILIIWLIC